jgi:hypothetical protein
MVVNADPMATTTVGSPGKLLASTDTIASISKIYLDDTVPRSFAMLVGILLLIFAFLPVLVKKDKTH